MIIEIDMNSLLFTVRKYLKRSRLLYSVYTRLFDVDFRKQKERMYSSNKKSEDCIKNEMRLYSNYWGVPADEYIRYGLFEKQLSEEEILDYIPTQVFYCEYLRRSYQNIDTNANDDKWHQYEILSQLNIPTPNIEFLIHNGRLQNKDKKDVDFSDLQAVANEGEKIFIKPTNGCGGSGIIVLVKRGGLLYKKGAIIQGLEDLNMSNNVSYVVQKGIVQNAEISKIYDGSINTLRTIVQYRDGETNVVGCILRMGRNGADVDNSAQGGISVNVNFDDGSFGPFAIAEHGGEIFTSHPNSGYVFNGNSMPNWADVKQEILKNVGKMTQYNDVGWDIAVTDNGICVIEFNLGYGIVHAQTCCGGLRRKLNVYPK